MPDEPAPRFHLPPEAFNTPELKRELAESIHREIRAKFPKFWEALEEDTKVFLKERGERRDTGSAVGVLREAVRLCWVTDSFLALSLYRCRARLLAREVPILPRLIHKICMVLSQLDIGEPVLIEPGVYIPHGLIVIDGRVEVGRGSVLGPWLTIGLIEGSIEAPRIGPGTVIGASCKILGNVTIGARAVIGDNTVVVKDVAPGTSVSGVPARPVDRQLPPHA